MALPFASPEIHGGGDFWGPTEPPELFTDVPYTAFSKTDKVGKAADWTGRQRQYFQKPVNPDGDEFVVVDSKAAYKEKKFGPRRYNRRRAYEKDVGPEKNSNQRPQRSRREREMQARRKNVRTWRDRNEPIKVKESSVEVKGSWEMIEQLDLQAMQKLKINAEKLAPPEDMKWCGSLGHYDKAFDRVTTKNPQKLQAFAEKTFHSVSTTDDPVIRELTRSKECNVYTTDAILACIAAAPRSVYSWDLVFHRVGDSVFIDKREDSQFDFLTVNETSHEPPSSEDAESVNSMQSLSQEATMINQNFSQQILRQVTTSTRPHPPTPTHTNPHHTHTHGSERSAPCSIRPCVQPTPIAGKCSPAAAARARRPLAAVH